MANVVTIARFFTIPFFVWFFAEGWIWWAAGVFGIGVLTDWLDGFVARRRDEVSAFGQFADPLVDKLLVTAALLVFLERGLVGVVAVIVLIGREFFVMGLRAWGVSKGKGFGANFWGKLKALLQFGFVFYALLLVGNGAGGMWLVVKDWLLWSTVVVSVLSGVLYGFLIWQGGAGPDGARS